MAIYPYVTEPLTDFRKIEFQNKYKEELKKVSEHFGETYPLIIGGKEIYTDVTIDSFNPANHSELIGKVCQAGIKEAEDAMQVALAAFKSWSKVNSNFRADVLFKAAAICRRKKFELSAIITKEAGKPWAEADGDVAEAIDFLEYYGRQMLELDSIDERVKSRPLLERNEYRYIPLGVGAVITPWNFPFAILTGMTSAALVTGNTVLLKPSSNSLVIAYQLMKILTEAGLPSGVVNYIPGKGSEVGDYFVNHPQTRFISFTGSKAVGASIYEKAAKVQKGQIWLKRVIAEMGGKDAMIIDKDVDADYAAKEIITAAFGFSGQKCSACSRVIIHKDIYEEVVSNLVKRAKNVQVGDPALYETYMGPVIDEKAYNKITEYIKIGEKEGKIAFGGNSDNSKGWFIEPTIIIDVAPNSRIMQEEVFGPVLAVCKVKDFDQALAVANNTEYGLTGGVISNNRANLEKAKAEFHVGNLYLNRKCTGAIVGYQPFGGFNMSGTDSKAGGPDYLVLHMQGKSIAEQY